MKLRHKKPLNSYKGQTNNDKNEFNDDDFRQQGSPHKKNGITSTDQIFKYARILAKFVKTINQDYRQMEAPPEELNPDRTLDPTQPKEKPSPDLQRQIELMRKQQLKEQKQIAKLQPKSQIKQESKEQKNTNRKKETPRPPFSQPKETKPTLPDTPLGSEFPQKTNQMSFKPKSETKNKEINKPLSEKQDQNRTAPDIGGLGKPTGLKAAQGAPTQGNPLMGMNMNNQINLSNFMNMPPNLPNMPGMMNQGQLLGNMAMLGMNGMNNMSQMQLAQLLLRMNNPNFFYGQLPMGMGMNLGMMNMGMQNMPSNPQFMFQQQRVNQKPVPNLFNEQVNSFKSTQKNGKDIKAVYPLKRAAFHVAIAYKIYLDKLKRQGRSFESLEEIDPTKSARRIKSNQQQARGGRDNSLKKKK